jgi:hypothetical protein
MKHLYWRTFYNSGQIGRLSSSKNSLEISFLIFLLIEANLQPGSGCHRSTTWDVPDR